jgi:two-component system, cell cycle sensor histidine kinase and response regulator CckA
MPKSQRLLDSQFLRCVAASTSATMVEADECIVAVNQAFLDLCRYRSPEALLGQPVSILCADEDRDRVLEIKRRRLQGDPAPAIFEFQGKCGDGTLMGLEAFVSVSQVEGQMLLVTVVRDTSERKKVEQTLRNSEGRLRAALESLGEGVLITDTQDLVQFVSNRMLALTGFALEEMAGRGAFELLLPPAERETVTRRNQARLLEARERNQMRLLRSDGSSFWAAVTAVPFRDSEGLIVGTLRVITDITERKQDEERMKFQAVVLSQVREAIVAVDNEGLVSYWNQGAEELYAFKFHEALGRPLKELIGYDCLEAVTNDKVSAVLVDSRVWQEESIHRRSDGEAVSVELSLGRLKDVNGECCGYLAVIRDITERRSAAEILRQKEEQLRQAQKMEAIGKLAGSVAHDFNNLLTAILGYSELLLRRLDRNDPLRSDVEEIKRSGARASDLTRQLLAFSRKQVLQPQILDLNAVVLGMDKMLRRLIGAHIELVTVLEPGLAPIKADRGQIEQVILNLAVNARDAIAAGGKLTIETANVDAGPSTLHRTEDGPERCVMLVVSDTGCGMDAETQARIFEPFYTTKRQGEGTGLGLSTVYGIVEQSGGHIRVESGLLRGTTFRIFLPQEAPLKETSASIRGELDLPGGTETILLVEDDTIVSNLVHQILKRTGYHVLAAHHGAEALRVAIQHQGPIHLLLTDVVMPLMGGRDLAKRLRELRKGTKVLFMSGYTDDAGIHLGALEPGTGFIQKPFTPDSLSRKVRDVLDS